MSKLIWKGKAKDFKGWAKAMEDFYGKEETLENVIKDLKIRKLKRQINYMENHYGYKE